MSVPGSPSPLDAESPEPSAADEARDSASGPAAAAVSLISNSLDYARDVVALAAAELRLAALSGVTMLMLVIVTAALIVVAWTFIAAVLVYVLVELGLPWPAAGLLVAALHGIAAYILWRTVVRLSRSLTLPELRRSVLSQEE